MDIVITTNNNNKYREIVSILNFKQSRVLSLKDIDFNDKIIEDGQTYYDNARKKAQAIREKIQDKIILADDSGLEISALNNAPGVISARYLNGLSQKEKNAEIIKKLEKIDKLKRNAKFLCVVCLIMPDGESHFFNGVCEGHIAEEIQGERGFGYDPIFIPSGFLKTFGVLSEDIKNTISHRAIAFTRAKNFIVRSGLLE